MSDNEHELSDYEVPTLSSKKSLISTLIEWIDEAPSYELAWANLRKYLLGQE